MIEKLLILGDAFKHSVIKNECGRFLKHSPSTNIGNYGYVKIDGGYLAMCRNFQYVLSQDDKFNAIYKGNTQKHFYVVRLNDNFEFVEQIDIDIEIPYKYFQYVPSLSELRDFRLVEWNKKIYFSAAINFPDMNDWRTVICRQTSDDYKNWKIVYFSGTSSIEKNWMPVVDRPCLYISNISSGRLVVKNIESNLTLERPQTVDYDDIQFSGSSNLIKINDKYVCVVHRKHYPRHYGYAHYFVVLDERLDILSISKGFKFSSEYIEFCQSLIYDQKTDEIIIGFSALDRDNYLIKIKLDDIRDFMFKHVRNIKFDSGKYANAYWFDGWNNFGDMLVPHILKKFTGKEILNCKFPENNTERILSIGSLLYLHNVYGSDLIWGTGTHNFPGHARYSGKKKLNIKMVRGPLTRQLLLDDGQTCPEIYGDPGIFAAYAFNIDKNTAKIYDYGIIIHRNEKKANYSRINQKISELHKKYNIIEIDVTCPNGIEHMLNQIAKCKTIISSALHPIIVAESINIPCAWIQINANDEKIFKFMDYFFGSNRTNTSDVYPPNDWMTDEDIDLSKLKILPKPAFDIKKMIDTFPYEMHVSKDDIQKYYDFVSLKN